MVGLLFNGVFENNMTMTVQFAIKAICDNVDNVIVLDPFKGNKLTKILPKGIKVRKYCDALDYNSWEKIDEYTKTILEGIDTLIIYKTNILTGHCANDTKLLKRFEKNRKINDEYSINFRIVKQLFIKYNVVLNAAKTCKYIYQFYLDPKEPCLNDNLNFKNYKKVYCLNRPNGEYIYIPFFEQYVIKCAEHIEKDCDFLFYCTAIADERAYIADIKYKIESIPGWDTKIIVRKSVDSEGAKRMEQKEYYHKLAKSRYTICIQSYDPSTFSIYRFIEAVANDCLPFIHNGCCLDDVKCTFPDIYEIMKNKLIVKGFMEVKRKIDEIPEGERINILNEIKNTKSWKNFTNEKFIKKCWKQLKGLKVK